MGTESTNRILVVDDDARLARALARMLAAHGYLVELAFDGLQAIRLLGERGFDLVLTDLFMPGASGLEVASAAARLARPPAVRVMTGTPASELLARVADLVGSPALLKPVEEEELLGELRRALAAGRRSGPAEPAARVASEVRAGGPDDSPSPL